VDPNNTGLSCARCGGAITHSCTQQTSEAQDRQLRRSPVEGDRLRSAPNREESGVTMKPFRAWVAIDPRGLPDLRTMSAEHRYSLAHWKKHFTQSYLPHEQVEAASYPERFDLPNYAWELAQSDGWRVIEVEGKPV
jgi:hypothetical protein